MELAEVDSGAEEGLLLGRTRIWAVGGGKGGVGKSFVSANLAVGLARRGLQVVVVDADLGGANMHTCLGIAYPSRHLGEFIDGQASTLQELLLPTRVPGLQLISGASDLLALANPQYAQKQKLLRHLRRLQADVILLDLGAGTSFNVLDFFNLAHRKLMVVTPEPTSIQNGYGFLKSALFRALGRAFSQNTLVTDLLRGHSPFPGEKPDTIKQMLTVLRRELPEVAPAFEQVVQGYAVQVVLNMASPPQDQKVFAVLRSVGRGFLSVEPQLLGAVPRDERVIQSVEQMSPLLLAYPESAAALKLERIIDGLMADHRALKGSASLYL